MKQGMKQGMQKSAAPPAGRPTAHDDGAAVEPSAGRVPRALMYTCAVAAASAGAVATTEVLTAPTGEVAEVWRAFGLLVFSGLFVALARRPSGNRLLWGVVLGHKAAMAGYAGVALAAGPGAAERQDLVEVLLVDGALAAMLAVAFVACRGWRPVRR